MSFWTAKWWRPCFLRLQNLSCLSAQTYLDICHALRDELVTVTYTMSPVYRSQCYDALEWLVSFLFKEWWHHFCLSAAHITMFSVSTDPRNCHLWLCDKPYCEITSTINQQMHLYNFHLKRFKTLQTTLTCFDLFRSSSGSFVLPCWSYYIFTI